MDEVVIGTEPTQEELELVTWAEEQETKIGKSLKCGDAYCINDLRNMREEVKRGP